MSTRGWNWIWGGTFQRMYYVLLGFVQRVLILMTNIMRRNETKMKPDCQSFGRVERGRETCPISHLGSRTNQINTKEEEGRKRSTKEVVTFWSEEDIKMLHTTDLFLLRLLMRRSDAFLQSSTLARILNLSVDPPLQNLSLCIISVCRWDAFSKGIRTQFPNLMSYSYESSPKYGISRVPLQRQFDSKKMERQTTPSLVLALV